MSSGLQLFNSSGTLIFDTTAKGAILHDVFNVAAGSGSYTVSYPELAGRTVRWLLMPQNGTTVTDFNDEQECCDIYDAYGSGYPVLTVYPKYRATTVYVFLKT